jgi:hypothetical protein
MSWLLIVRSDFRFCQNLVLRKLDFRGISNSTRTHSSLPYRLQSDSNTYYMSICYMIAGFHVSKLFSDILYVRFDFILGKSQMKLSRLDLKHCECCPLPHRKILNIVLSSLLVENASFCRGISSNKSTRCLIHCVIGINPDDWH